MKKHRHVGNIWGAPRTPRHDFYNLHDVFLNVSLERRCMLAAPVDRSLDGLRFSVTDRARHERIYAAFLYVLVEAWTSEGMSQGREFAAALTRIDQVDQVLAEARAHGGLDKLRAVRDYVCHRDRREYWDEGRNAVFGEMSTHEAIFRAFDSMFLAALMAIPREPPTP